MKRNRAGRRERRSTVRAAVDTAYALGGALAAARMVAGLKRHTRCPSCAAEGMLGRKRSASSGDRDCRVCAGSGVLTVHRAIVICATGADGGDGTAGKLLLTWLGGKPDG